MAAEVLLWAPHSCTWASLLPSRERSSRGSVPGAGLSTTQGALLRRWADSTSLALRRIVQLCELQQSAEIMASTRQRVPESPWADQWSGREPSLPQLHSLQCQPSSFLSSLCPSQDPEVAFVLWMSLWKTSRPSNYQLPSVVLLSVRSPAVLLYARATSLLTWHTDSLSCAAQLPTGGATSTQPKNVPGPSLGNQWPRYLLAQ